MILREHVVADPKNPQATIIRLVGDLTLAKSVHNWIESANVQADLPLPAFWENAEHFQTFGYEIKVHDNVATVIQLLRIP